ncbi:MAG: extracellular solute-binding protein, partial [Candidatus Babeliales bacterium]|nr:extracellular solute-binding protein [Candidatus Babeliales bacterium]
MNDNTRSIGAHAAIVLFWSVVIILFLWAPFFISNMYKQKSLTVLAWPGLLDVQYLQKFEQKTGIKVNVRYFESNEELYLKIKETKGKGYDLIMPSDYMTDLMIKDNLLKKIDKKKLHFFDQLNPHLIGKYYDKNNDYSIPFFWSMYGIAIDKDYFKDKELNRSWSLVFDQKHIVPHTCVIDDVRELILIAAQYLYGKQDNLNDSQLEEIKNLLIAQKKSVEVYAEDRANTLLASQICPVAIILSAVVARIMAVY